MKNFEDFCKTVTGDEISSIFNDAEEILSIVREDSTRSPAYLGNQIGIISLSVALSVVQRYHEWLHDDTE